MELLDKQIDGFLNRIIDSASPAATRAYERKIADLEKQKLLAEEKLGSLSTRAQVKPITPNAVLELSLRFLSNPCKLWESGNIALQRLTLKLAFCGSMPYSRKNGILNTKKSLPFKVLKDIQEGEIKMVRPRRLELPRVLPHSDLNAARLPVPPRPHAVTKKRRKGALR